MNRSRVARAAAHGALALAIALPACNVGRSLIEKAQQQHQQGDMTTALATLGQVALEAPGSVEVPTATALAVDWLLAAAKEARSPQRRIELAENALKWSPESGRAQVVICEVHAQEGDADALRECLGPGLEKKKDLAPTRLEQLRATERKLLMDAATRVSWERVIALYPGTAEAAQATDHLKRLASVCYPLSEWKSSVLAAVQDIDKQMSQLKARMSVTSTPLEGLRVIESYKNHFRDTAVRLEEEMKQVENHDLLPGEEAVRKALVTTYSDSAKAHRLYELGFSKVLTIGYIGSQHASTYRMLSTSTARNLKSAAEKCQSLNTKAAPQQADVAIAPVGNSADTKLEAAEQLRRAVLGLKQSLAESPETLAKLAASQKAWEAYRTAHALERFPHDEPRFYYGSVYSMCVGAEHAAMDLARAEQLRGNGACAGSSTEEQAQSAAKSAEALLTTVYRKVRSTHEGDTEFLAALKSAELSWIRFRDAQIAFVQALPRGAEPGCTARETEAVIRFRTEQLQGWLQPVEEGEVCAGSFSLP